jgi:hypothetical protein
MNKPVCVSKESSERCPWHQTEEALPGDFAESAVDHELGWTSPTGVDCLTHSTAMDPMAP